MVGSTTRSPASIAPRRDRFTKRRLYQEVGVPIYGVVDADAGAIEVRTPEAQFPQVMADELIWHPAGAPEPLTIPLGRLFRPL